jgi:hypothetical protein
MSDVIRSKLRESGLEVTEVLQYGMPQKLMATDPRRPGAGHVTIKASGLIEPDRWRQLTDQRLAAHVAAVVVSILMRNQT